MMLSAQGWSRNCGDWTLVSTNLNDKPPRETLSMGEVAVNKNLMGMRVWWSSPDVQLNGNYSFMLDLSKSDIARLFVDAFSDVDLDNLLTFIHAARFKSS